MLYRRIFPREYFHLCQNERERKRITRAESLVDFVELGRHGGGVCRDGSDIPALYSHLVQNAFERVPWERIAEGIALQEGADWSSMKECGYRARFHAIAALREGRAVGMLFFKSMRMDCSNYFTALMYAGAADRDFASARYGFCQDFRGRGIARALLLLSHGITLEDAERDGRSGVAGAFCDSVLGGQGAAGGSVREARMGLELLSRLGMLPMMYDTGGGEWLAPAIQPALGEQTDPLVMHMLFRPFHGDIQLRDGMFPLERVFAAKIISAYIRSYDAIESNGREIGSAKDGMLTRFEMARRVVLMHPRALPPIEALAKSDPLLRTQLDSIKKDNHQEA